MLKRIYSADLPQDEIKLIRAVYLVYLVKEFGSEVKMT